MVWAGGRSRTGSSWVSPSSQVSRDTGQLLSSALLAQTLSPIFFSLLNPCQMITLPRVPSAAAAPCPGRRVQRCQRTPGCPGVGTGKEGWGQPLGAWAVPGHTVLSPGPTARGHPRWAGGTQQRAQLVPGSLRAHRGALKR